MTYIGIGKVIPTTFEYDAKFDNPWKVIKTLIQLRKIQHEYQNIQ